MKISAIVITSNEEKNINDCLESLVWADEIIVVDSYSKDKTVEIARKFTSTIFLVDMQSITEKRKFSVSKASHDWVFFLDADERITPELSDEIIAISDDSKAGYYVNRKNYYLGKWIKHCGIYPDYHIRLFNKNKAHVNDRIIHEDIVTDGETVKLTNPMLHLTAPDMSSLIKKADFFSTMEGLEQYEHGKKITKAGVFTHALATFLVMFFSRGGFKDGIVGFYVSFSYSLNNFLTHLKLLKLQSKI